MASENGSGFMDLRQTDLEDWWLVDALDGRRWIGLVVAGFGWGINVSHILLQDELMLKPAFEVPPDRALHVAMVQQPSIDPRTMRNGPGQSVPMPLPVANFSIALLGNLEKNDFPPVYVRYASRSHLKEWGKEPRDILARILTTHLQQEETKIRPPILGEGPQEKVR